MHKELRKIANAATKRGWTLKVDSKHYMLIHPSGRKVSFSRTPSDGMARWAVQRDIDRVEREEQARQVPA